MPNIVILYDTVEGQTRRVAQRMAGRVTGAGHQVEIHEIRRLPTNFTVGRFDAVIVGASIHLGKHSKRLTEFVDRHRTDLGKIPSAFFSVSLSAAGTEEERKEAKEYVTEFLKQTGWHPKMTAIFGGGLLYREYWFLKRWMMKKIAKGGGKDTDTSKNHIYTNWDAVEGFTEQFLLAFNGSEREAQSS